MRREIAIPDRGQEVVDGSVSVQPGHLEQLRFRQLFQADAMHAVQLLVEKVMPLGDVLLATLALEPLADSLLARRALDEVQPVVTRTVRSLGGEDLDDLAVLQRVLE